MLHNKFGSTLLISHLTDVETEAPIWEPQFGIRSIMGIMLPKIFTRIKNAQYTNGLPIGKIYA